MLERRDRFLRVLACAVCVGSLSYMTTRAQTRLDVTAEGLSEVTDQTQALVKEAAKARPIQMTAYISKEVPRDFVAHRDRLLNVLREIDAYGGDAVSVQIFEPEPHSEQAQEARDKYGIFPRPMLDAEAGRVGALPVFMGVAVSGGPKEQVLPFVDRGLSAEYELARAISVVSGKKPPVVGVVRNDAQLMGGFDMQARRQLRPWAVISELKKQYDVRSLELSAPVPEDVDVVMVPQVSSLTQPELDQLTQYAKKGGSLLIAADPLPLFNLSLSPSMPMAPRGGGMMMGQQAQAPQKGDYAAFLAELGVSWDSQAVLSDADASLNQQFSTPPQVLFISRADGEQTLAESEGVSQGLAQVVAVYAGALRSKAKDGLVVTPVLSTSQTVGTNPFDAFIDRSNPFGQVRGPIPPRRAPQPLDGAQAVGLEIEPANGQSGAHAIVLGDLDMFSDTFFQLHQQGGDLDADGLIDQRFDNASFLLNCIDRLAGESRFVSLRGRQPAFRRLVLVDDLTQKAREERELQIAQATQAADARLGEAQKALDAKVAQIEARTDLDENAKRVKVRQIHEVENRRFQRSEQAIERDKARELDRIETQHLTAVDAVQDSLRLLAILLPPLPAIGLGLYILIRKRKRESASIPSQRKRTVQ